jgi:hypothetical protein
MAYINNGEKGLELYPNSGGADDDSGDDQGKMKNGDDEINAKKSKLSKLFMNKKPEANDGDIENFYSADPSKVSII